MLHAGKDTETVSDEQYFSPDPTRRAGGATFSVHVADRSLQIATARGTFSARRLDPGTRVLLDTVEQPPATGELLDLGCGVGVLGLAMATYSPAARVWGVDVNPLALERARENAVRNRLGNVAFARPEEVPEAISFATIWSNPPVRVGKGELHAILERWLPRLSPGADAWLVAQRHLGADSLAAWLEGRGCQVERAASRRGYRVLRVRWLTPTTDRPRPAG